MFVTSALTNPDLQIRGGGVIQTLRWGGGGVAVLKKNVFSSFGPQFWSKEPSPGSATARVSQIVSSSRLIFLKFLLLKKLTFSSDEGHQINPMTIVRLN